jgi:hypothetical protein
LALTNKQWQPQLSAPCHTPHRCSTSDAPQLCKVHPPSMWLVDYKQSLEQPPDQYSQGPNHLTLYSTLLTAGASAPPRPQVQRSLKLTPNHTKWMGSDVAGIGMEVQADRPTWNDAVRMPGCLHPCIPDRPQRSRSQGVQLQDVGGVATHTAGAAAHRRQGQV